MIFKVFKLFLVAFMHIDSFQKINLRNLTEIAFKEIRFNILLVIGHLTDVSTTNFIIFQTTPQAITCSMRTKTIDDMFCFFKIVFY